MRRALALFAGFPRGKFSLAIAFALAFLFNASTSHAQEHAHSLGAPDVGVFHGELTLLPAPEGFVTVERDGVTWEYPSRAGFIVEPLFETWDVALPRVREELGASDALPHVRIRIGRDPDEMNALAPVGAAPPAYAVGVAYPSHSLILLTLTAPQTWQPPEVHEVLVHEMSHVVLHHALGDGAFDVPLWLVEGVAIHQARERSTERIQALWHGALSGNLLTLDELDARFPTQPHAVNLAYAESADFVAWLLRRDGPAKLRRLVERMNQGERFEVAVSQTWSQGIGQLEHSWRENLDDRFGSLPLFIVSGAGWAFAGLLVIPAWSRRRNKRGVIYARWEEEDRQKAALEEAYRRQALRIARARAAMMAHTGALAAGALATTSAPSTEAGELEAGASTEMPACSGEACAGEAGANEDCSLASPAGNLPSDATQNDPSGDESFMRDQEPGDRTLH